MQEHSRLIATSFLWNTLVHINEIGRCFILAKKVCFPKTEKSFEIEHDWHLSSQVIFY